jgi:hypothetical protein
MYNRIKTPYPTPDEVKSVPLQLDGSVHNLISLSAMKGFKKPYPEKLT